MLFIYILSRLYILLILTLTPHMSLRTGHMARFNALYAPHVPQIRTHGAIKRPICPICPSNPDTWCTSTAYMPHLSLKPGQMERLNGGANTQKAWRWVGRLREAEEKAYSRLENWR